MNENDSKFYILIASYFQNAKTNYPMITNAPGLVINGLGLVDVDTIIAIMIGPAKNTVFKTQLEKSRIFAKYPAIAPIVFLRKITCFH